MSFCQINRVERVKDLRKVLTDRHGRTLPNDEGGRKLLAIVIDHALLIARDFAVRMAQQLAPAEISDAEISYMIDREGRMWGVQALAVELGLTEAERVRLGVRTIGAVDITPANRRTRKRARERLRRAARLAAEAERQGLDAGATAR